MLKKLLKYDFKSVFKYWWIAALSSLALCVLGGGCINVLQSARDLPTIVDASAGLFLGLSIVSVVAFMLVSVIFVYVRFYKNFFTDEGYLTFTLPVKRTTLLNSKLIMSTGTVIATIIAGAINVGVMLLIGFNEIIFSKPLWKEIKNFIRILLNEIKGYSAVYLIEAVLILILLTVFSVLFVFCCITFASIITKKARVITAIGIYYGANMIFSFAVEIFAFFGISGILERIGAVGEEYRYPLLSLVIFGVIVLITLFCGMLYTLQYYMLDRRLNLA